MMKRGIGPGWLYMVVCLSTMMVPIGIQRFFFREPAGVELRAALGLLLLNFGFFMALCRQNSGWAVKMGASFALLLITLKLFVNTFTIFLFIGLQAVRTHVFVSEFLAGYTVLLTGGIFMLHWNSKRF